MESTPQQLVFLFENVHSRRAKTQLMHLIAGIANSVESRQLVAKVDGFRHMLQCLEDDPTLICEINQLLCMFLIEPAESSTTDLYVRAPSLSDKIVGVLYELFHPPRVLADMSACCVGMG